MSEDGKVTAWTMFNRLGGDAKRMLKTRFDAWVDGIHKTKWYHGWNQTEFGGKYTQCFVFKCKEKGSFHRFYGFLCRPRKPLDPRYEACILVSHVHKKQWEVNPTDLERVEEIRTKPAVQKAVSDYFEEKL